MCESTAYLVKEGVEKIILEGVDRLENEDDQIILVSIFGEQMRIKARIKTLSLVDHKIILEPI